MDPAAIADYVVPASGGGREEPFLLARLVCDQLIARPVDTTMAGWESQVAGSVFQALNAEITAAPPPPHRPLSPTESAEFGRQLLTALTWGFGGGLPETEWIAVATALSADLGVGEVSAADISWVLDQLGRYILVDGEAGQAVYRLAHQSLADYLRPPYESNAEELFDLRATPVTAALLGLYERQLRVGLAATDPVYLWRYAWRHATLSGLDGLARLKDVAVVTDDLAWDVAMTCEAVSDVLARWGRHGEALPPAEEAVELYRGLSADNPDYLPDLASALNNLGNRLAELGRHSDALSPTEEAVRLYRGLAAENPGNLPNLASALNNLGSRLAELGRRGAALSPTEESVQLRRGLAANNPGYLPDLASALTNLGNRLADLGMHGDALPPAEEAVQLCRGLAAENPGYLPDLAGALTNLGNRLAALGRHGDGLAPAEEAVQLRRDLAAANPGYLPNLAIALNNLGISLAGLGRRGDALSPTEEAMELFRVLAADNQGYLPNLAGALTNLGNILAGLGRDGDALPPVEEAVQLRRVLVADNPGYIAHLADALNHLGSSLGDLGRHSDALAPVEESVQLYRGLAADNPGYLPDLANGLNDLGIRLAELSRHAEALAPTEEAVQLRHRLAADNPDYQPDLAAALSNLGSRLAKLGRHSNALAATEQAVHFYRGLAADNPGHLPNLAGTLSNLSNRLAGLGQHADALAASEEAVQLYRGVAADNPGHLPDLAGALNNLGNRLAELSRHADALRPVEEAVQLYRDLSLDNPGHLLNLATTTRLLGRLSGQLEGSEAVYAVWQPVLDGFPPDARALLLLYRAQQSDDDLAAAGWLAEADTLVTDDDQELMSAIHDETRRLRTRAPAQFDDGWTTATGSPVPDWARVDPELISTVREWSRTATYFDEAAFLAAHHELLRPQADIAVHEGLFALPADDAARHQRLRTEAQATSVDAAYRQLVVSELAAELVHADPAQQRQLLASRQAELLDKLVAETIRGWSAEDDTGQAAAALSLLTLAATEPPAFIDELLDSADNPDRFNDLLQRTAEAGRVATLAEAASYGLAAANSRRVAVSCLLFLAVAAILDHDAAAAARYVTAAHNADPGARDGWIRLVGQIGAHQPEVLKLIPMLTNPA